VLADRLAEAERLGRQSEIDAALAIYADLRAGDPEHPAPWLNAALLARGAGWHDEADRLVDLARARFPQLPRVWMEWGFNAHIRRDWKVALERWHLLLARYPDAVAPYVQGAIAFRELGRHDAAEMLLREGQQRFPAVADLFAEYAWLAQRRRDWPEALLRWEDLRARFPGHGAGYTAAAAALRELGRHHEAALLLAQADGSVPDDKPAAPARFADVPESAEQAGLNAGARDDWAAAVAHLQAAVQRFPAVPRLRQRLYEAQLRLAGSGPAPAPLQLVEDDPDRALVLRFESLGGTGHGCEFGIFQRGMGAEPLGLLRWADLGQHALCNALETEFAGVGEPEFTRLFVPDNSNPAEYWTTDTRHHMAMRTFVLVADMPEDRMQRQVSQRLRFLRRKLIDDLRAAEKIFVYKNMRRNLTGDELARLHREVRAYGDTTLFYIAYADPQHPPGTVESGGPGLIRGYIEHFSHHPATDAFFGHVHQELLALCRKALAVRQADRAAGAGSTLGPHPAA